MKLSDYAKKVGVHYHTAWRWYRSGRISGYQLETGTIIVTESDDAPRPQQVAIYARVSSPEMKDNLQRQADRLVDSCAAKGWPVSQVVEAGGCARSNRLDQLPGSGTNRRAGARAYPDGGRRRAAVGRQRQS